jgi:hypothetical protein
LLICKVAQHPIAPSSPQSAIASSLSQTNNRTIILITSDRRSKKRSPFTPILDWYHLVEHLHGFGGSILRLENAEQFLWNGDVESAIP